MAIEADFHLQAKALGGEKWGNQLVSVLNAIDGGSPTVAALTATTSITTPTLTVTAGGDGSTSLLTTGALATFTLLSGSFSAGMTVSGALSQASILGTSGAASFYLGAVEAAASSYTKRIYTVTGIDDNSATNVITVTVPNANHVAAIHLKILSMNGGADAFESARIGTGTIVLARTTGANVVAAAATLTLTGIATVSGGATHTLAYGVTSITGAVGATNTFSITLTIDDSGNLGSNKAIIVAELINSEGTGVTMAAAA